MTCKKNAKYSAVINAKPIRLSPFDANADADEATQTFPRKALKAFKALTHFSLNTIMNRAFGLFNVTNNTNKNIDKRPNKWGETADSPCRIEVDRRVLAAAIRLRCGAPVTGDVAHFGAGFAAGVAFRSQVTVTRFVRLKCAMVGEPLEYARPTAQLKNLADNLLTNRSSWLTTNQPRMLSLPG